MQRNADVRVLKAQLDLIADVVYGSGYVARVWAATVGFLGSKSLGILGNQQLSVTMILAALVGAVTLVAARVVRVYQHQAAGDVSIGELQAWFPRFLTMQLAISTAWGLMVWVLWAPDGIVNH